MEMGSQYGEQRLIYDENGSLVSALEPMYAKDICVGSPIYRMRDDYIRKRQYDRRVEELYVGSEFRRYGRNVQANIMVQWANCETYMIVAFTKMDVEYPCFYYECARILLKRLQENLLHQEDLLCQEGIIAAVKKLANIDLKLWKRWIQKNESNSCWQKLLFTVLSQVDKNALEMFAQTIHLDMPIQDYKPDILLTEFERLADSSKNYILVHVSGIIIDRWNDLIDKKKKAFVTMNKPLFTGYINLILNSFQESLQDKEKWKTAFLKQAEILEEDMYRWYAREINMESIFFYDITQLYYILIVGQECQLIEIDEVISNCMQKVKMVIERYDYFWRECEGKKADFEKRLRDNSILK